MSYQGVLSPLSAVDRDRLRAAVMVTSLRRQAVIAGVTSETLRRALDGARLQPEVCKRILSALDSTEATEGKEIPVRVIGRTEGAEIDAANICWSMVEICCDALESAIGAHVVAVGGRGECYIAATVRNVMRWWRITHCPWCGERRP